MQFTGEFDPIPLDRTRVPVAVEGPGTLTATEDGLVVEAFRARSVWPMFVVTCLAIFLAMQGGEAFFDGSMIVSRALGCVAAVLCFAIFGRLRSVRRKPVRLTYSWHQFEATKLAEDRCSFAVQLSGAGALHFRPELDAATVIAHLQCGPAIDDDDLTHAVELWQGQELDDGPHFRS